jgi:nucleotide-binding universal stress UspA family protein
MSMIQTILVAVDFSEASERALDMSIELCTRFGASLELVHALEVPMPSVSPYGVVTSDSTFADVRRAARAKLAALKSDLEERGFQPRAHLAEPPAPTAIDDMARSIEADLIIMGTRGNTGLKHVLLGSVAERTLRHAPCPVLTVK